MEQIGNYAETLLNLTEYIPEILIAAFTGVTAWATWRALKIQQSSTLPAVFLELEPYDNGLVLSVTVRNRSDHPQRVESIHLLKPRLAKLLPVQDYSNGEYSDGTRVNAAYGADEIPSKAMPADMVLGSAGRPSDSGHREYLIRDSTSDAREVKVKVVVDPSDGTWKKHSIVREINLPKELRSLLEKSGL